MKRIRRMPRIIKTTFPMFLVIATLMVMTIIRSDSQGAYAGAEVVGNPDGSTVRALVGRQDGSVQRIVYFAAGVKTMATANTPVASDPQCGLGGSLHKAEVQLVGTMGGTAPTLAIKWQNSIDGGANWNDVGTWTTINATVTPVSQSNTVSDIYNASTAVAYGDCWRATYVFGGTGTVTANISIKGVEK